MSTPLLLSIHRKGSLIFDSHVHLGRSVFAPALPASDSRRSRVLPIYGNARENLWNTYAREAERYGICKALVFPFPFPSIDIRKANEYVIDATHKRPDLFIPLLLISPKTEQLIQYLDVIAGAKEEFYLPEARSNNSFLASYDLLQQFNRVLLIHPHQSERISRIQMISSNFPRLKIIIAHSGRKMALYRR